MTENQAVAVSFFRIFKSRIRRSPAKLLTQFEGEARKKRRRTCKKVNFFNGIEIFQYKFSNLTSQILGRNI